MSCSYAEGLSPYEHKGKLGLKEVFESRESLIDKVKQLSKWISSSKHVVVHTGAGISTSAGIPDFRGPKGVWTLEEQGKKPEISISFNDALPTKTHMILVKLVEEGFVKYVISQNIDGLHLRSGLSREYISELHGNMFINQCGSCKRQFVRKSATTSVGQKCLGLNCPGVKTNGRPCRGVLHDFVLDWEHSLPEKDLDLSHYHSNLADLSICLGTTLQIIPSGNLPLFTKKNQNGKLVICNLQPTKYDKKADMILNGYVDEVMCLLLEYLDLKVDGYNFELDPVNKKGIQEWTIPDPKVKEMKKIYEIHLKSRKTNDEEQRKRKTFDKSDTIPFKKIEENKDTKKLEKAKNVCTKVDNVKTIDSSIIHVKCEVPV